MKNKKILFGLIIFLFLFVSVFAKAGYYTSQNELNKKFFGGSEGYELNKYVDKVRFEFEVDWDPNTPPSFTLESYWTAENPKPMFTPGKDGSETFDTIFGEITPPKFYCEVEDIGIDNDGRDERVRHCHFKGYFNGNLGNDWLNYNKLEIFTSDPSISCDLDDDLENAYETYENPTEHEDWEKYTVYCWVNDIREMQGKDSFDMTISNHMYLWDDTSDNFDFDKDVDKMWELNYTFEISYLDLFTVTGKDIYLNMDHGGEYSDFSSEDFSSGLSDDVFSDLFGIRITEIGRTGYDYELLLYGQNVEIDDIILAEDIPSLTLKNSKTSPLDSDLGFNFKYLTNNDVGTGYYEAEDNNTVIVNLIETYYGIPEISAAEGEETIYLEIPNIDNTETFFYERLTFFEMYCNDPEMSEISPGATDAIIEYEYESGNRDIVINNPGYDPRYSLGPSAYFRLDDIEDENFFGDATFKVYCSGTENSDNYGIKSSNHLNLIINVTDTFDNPLEFYESGPDSISVEEASKKVFSAEELGINTMNEEEDILIKIKASVYLSDLNTFDFVSIDQEIDIPDFNLNRQDGTLSGNNYYLVFEVKESDSDAVIEKSFPIYIFDTDSLPKLTPRNTDLETYEDPASEDYLSLFPDYLFSQVSDDGYIDTLRITNFPSAGFLYINNKIEGDKLGPLTRLGSVLNRGTFNRIIYVPQLEFSGTDYIGITYFDDLDNPSEELRINIDVIPTNDFPTLESLEGDNEISEDAFGTFIIDIEDSDSSEFNLLSLTSSNEDIVPNNILTSVSTEPGISISGEGTRKYLKVRPIPNKYGELKIQYLFEDVVEDGTIGSPGPVSGEIDIIVSNVPDAPNSENVYIETYESMPVTIDLSKIPFNDSGDGDQFNSVKIINNFKNGYLLFGEERIHSDRKIKLIQDSETGEPLSETQFLHYVPNEDFKGDDTSRFVVYDSSNFNNNSISYELGFKVLASPFGPNSQPADKGGIIIPNYEFGEWSCKAGYQPIQSSVSNKYTCELIPNTPPVANFTIAPLVDNTAYKGQTIYFNSYSVDPDFDSMSYNWSFKENGSKTETINNFNGSICTNNTCSVTLVVSDDEDSSTLTKTFQYKEQTDNEEIEKEIEDFNSGYQNLVIAEGRTYSELELSSLNLKSGSTVTQGSRKITVDNVGKITKIEALQANTASPLNSETRSDKFIIGDGSCSKSIGESSVNSPQDCKEGSGLLGIIIVFSFISILGILGFVAWKKGLFNKLGSSKKSIAKPVTYDAPSYTAPTNSSEVPTSNFLSKMIKEKIDQGYSEGEIKSYLISKGYSESEIDNAINS